ncbi:hypothetical protein VNO77_01929 [Canavalia gladiata]|uniref:Uncharacterized protein n=1 Tax=Canavalia gladiata TaxID=3824 RepID=A0AAN9R2K3_CANGL
MHERVGAGKEEKKTLSIGLSTLEDLFRLSQTLLLWILEGLCLWGADDKRILYYRPLADFGDIKASWKAINFRPCSLKRYDNNAVKSFFTLQDSYDFCELLRAKFEIVQIS